MRSGGRSKHRGVRVVGPVLGYARDEINNPRRETKARGHDGKIHSGNPNARASRRIDHGVPQREQGDGPHGVRRRGDKGKGERRRDDDGKDPWQI